MCLSVYLCMCLFVCPSIYIFFFLSIYWSLLRYGWPKPWAFPWIKPGLKDFAVPPIQETSVHSREIWLIRMVHRAAERWFGIPPVAVIWDEVSLMHPRHSPRIWEVSYPKKMWPHLVRGSGQGLVYSCFTSAPCSCVCPKSVKRGTFDQFWLEQVQDIGHFSIRVASVALSGRCYNVGKRGSKWEVVLEVDLWQARYLVNLWLESRFVKLSSFSIQGMMMFACGTCSAADASGSFFVSCEVLCTQSEIFGSSYK